MKHFILFSYFILNSVAWGLTTTTYNPPALPPILESNPTNAIRKASSASNDPAPFFDLLGYNRVDNTTVPNAVCNDGTKPVYYLRKGAGQGANRWIIWLEGGGGCGSSDPTSPYYCGLRKNTPMWTSNNLIGVLQGPGIFSSQKSINPDFYSYNHVLVHYCSSDFWRGQGVQKVINPTTNEKWWFSGQRIVEAVVKDLETKHGFKNASNIILSGTSAGAIGITMNTNMIKDIYPTKDIVTIIDAAWANAFNRFDANSPGGYNESSIDDPQLMFTSYAFTGLLPSAECLSAINYCPPNARCADRRKYCVLPPVSSQYLKVPYFAIHDHYDRVLSVLGYGWDICQYTDKTKYETWLNNYLTVNTPSLRKSKGFFETRSGAHGMLSVEHFNKYKVTNGTASYYLKDVLGAWYFGRTNVPSTWIEPQNTALRPDEEVRTKNNCNW